MTEGISKKRLIELFSVMPDNDAIRAYDIRLLIETESKELDPWLPIYNAPKDRPIWLFNGYRALAQWSETLMRWHVMVVYHETGVKGFDKNMPYTHYKELPEDPK